MAELLTRLQAALADRYTIEREVGHGGMAVVFLAHDNKHHRPVAIKVLRPELAASSVPKLPTICPRRLIFHRFVSVAPG